MPCYYRVIAQGDGAPLLQFETKNDKHTNTLHSRSSGLSLLTSSNLATTKTWSSSSSNTSEPNVRLRAVRLMPRGVRLLCNEVSIIDKHAIVSQIQEDKDALFSQDKEVASNCSGCKSTSSDEDLDDTQPVASSSSSWSSATMSFLSSAVGGQVQPPHAPEQDCVVVVLRTCTGFWIMLSDVERVVLPPPEVQPPSRPTSTSLSSLHQGRPPPHSTLPTLKKLDGSCDSTDEDLTKVVVTKREMPLSATSTFSTSSSSLMTSSVASAPRMDDVDGPVTNDDDELENTTHTVPQQSSTLSVLTGSTTGSTTSYANIRRRRRGRRKGNVTCHKKKRLGTSDPVLELYTSSLTIATYAASTGGGLPLDPYEVLQVRRDGSMAEVRQAFRRLALLRHPRRGGGGGMFSGKQGGRAGSSALSASRARVTPMGTALTSPLSACYCLQGDGGDAAEDGSQGLTTASSYMTMQIGTPTAAEEEEKRRTEEEREKLLKEWKFACLGAAYETLIHKTSRRRYDFLAASSYSANSAVMPTRGKHRRDQSCSSVGTYSTTTTSRQDGEEDDEEASLLKANDAMVRGPLRNMYRARMYKPFADPYEMFSEVFRSNIFQPTEEEGETDEEESGNEEDEDDFDEALQEAQNDNKLVPDSAPNKEVPTKRLTVCTSSLTSPAPRLPAGSVSLMDQEDDYQEDGFDDGEIVLDTGRSKKSGRRRNTIHVDISLDSEEDIENVLNAAAAAASEGDEDYRDLKASDLFPLSPCHTNKFMDLLACSENSSSRSPASAMTGTSPASSQLQRRHAAAAASASARRRFVVSPSMSMSSSAPSPIVRSRPSPSRFNPSRAPQQGNGTAAAQWKNTSPPLWTGTSKRIAPDTIVSTVTRITSDGERVTRTTTIQTLPNGKKKTKVEVERGEADENDMAAIAAVYGVGPKKDAEQGCAKAGTDALCFADNDALVEKRGSAEDAAPKPKSSPLSPSWWDLLCSCGGAYGVVDVLETETVSGASSSYCRPQ